MTLKWDRKLIIGSTIGKLLEVHLYCKTLFWTVIPKSNRDDFFFIIVQYNSFSTSSIMNIFIISILITIGHDELHAIIIYFKIIYVIGYAIPFVYLNMTETVLTFNHLHITTNMYRFFFT